MLLYGFGLVLVVAGLVVAWGSCHCDLSSWLQTGMHDSRPASAVPEPVDDRLRSSQHALHDQQPVAVHPPFASGLDGLMGPDQPQAVSPRMAGYVCVETACAPASLMLFVGPRLQLITRCERQPQRRSLMALAKQLPTQLPASHSLQMPSGSHADVRATSVRTPRLHALQVTSSISAQLLSSRTYTCHLHEGLLQSACACHDRFPKHPDWSCGN